MSTLAAWQTREHTQRQASGSMLRICDRSDKSAKNPHRMFCMGGTKKSSPSSSLATLISNPYFESSRKSMQGACRVHALQSTHSSPRTRVSAPDVAQPSCCRFKHQSRDVLFEFEPPHPAENAVLVRSVPLVLRHGPPQNQGSQDTLRAPSGVA